MVNNKIINREVEFYQKQGFLMVPDALSPDEVDELRRETVRICRGEAGEVGGAPAVAAGDTDTEAQKRVLCIHMPHKISPTMRRYLSHPAMVEVLTKLIGPNVKCMQSMLFIKAAGKPGQAWHQDEDYIPTRDNSLTGGWIALDDATVENGCLWVLPGSHRDHILWPMRSHNDRRFDCNQESINFPYTDDEAVPVEVKAGSAVFFNGYLLHRSLPNRAASGFRRCLVNHYMNAQSLLPWNPPENGGLMAQADYRDIVLIAGNDPYAYKGIADSARPHIRPSGEGGCGDPKHNAATAEPVKMQTRR